MRAHERPNILALGLRIPLGLLATLALLMVGACGGGGSSGSSPSVVTDLRAVDVSVTLPPGASNLSGATILSQAAEFPVTGSTSTVLQEPEGRVLAVVQDASGKPLLYALITDAQRDISVTTTVETALYIGLNTVFLPDAIRSDFFGNVRTFPRFDEVVAQAEEMFRADPTFVDSDAFRTLMRDYIASLRVAEQTIDIRALRLDSGIRSGLQLDEQPGDNVTVVNTLRRRCHAFFYKVRTKDRSDNSTTLISDIAGTNATAFQQVRAGPTTDVSSVIGSGQNAAEGKGIEHFRVESDPVNLPLAESENEAEYWVRVIGPSTTPATLTTQEQERLRRLEFETLGLDIALPILLLAVGQDDFAKGLKETNPDFIVDAVQDAVAALPSVNDSLKKGDFGAAGREFLNAMRNSAQGGLRDTIIDVILTELTITKKISIDTKTRINMGAGKAVKVLDAIDLLLQAADLARVVTTPASTQMLEEFAAVNTRKTVRILPDSSIAIQGEGKSLEARITNRDPSRVYEFRWAVTGNWGVLRDSLGKEGTSFTTSRDTVEYFSSNVTDIPENATESVTVEVYVHEGPDLNEVDDAAAELMVRPEGFLIRPDGITINGGQAIILSVVRTDESNPTDSTFFDYRFEWETSRRFGEFSGGASRVNDNAMRYAALELDDEGIETFAVSIYTRAKGTNEPFEFLDKVEGELEIENDPLIRYLYVPLTIYSAPDALAVGYNFDGYIIQSRFAFSPVENALKYELTVLEHNPTGSPTFVGTRKNWEAGDPPDFNGGGQYYHGTFFGNGPLTSYADTLSQFNPTGLAQVKITLDPDKVR